MILNRVFLALFVVFLVVVGQISTAQAIGFAKIKVTVIDENGAPVSGAHLNVRFSSNATTIQGTTDEHGFFEAKSHSNDGLILAEIKKDGYYSSGVAHSFYFKRLGMWQPWGKEFTVVMRPIVNPVPMYYLEWVDTFPKFGETIGFDLIKADWVVPYGLGTHSDFIFKVERQWDDIDNFEVKMALTFANPHDGLIVVKDDGGGDFNAGSQFRLPRNAPEDGYQSTLEKRLSIGKYGWHFASEDDSNYIFRIRSEVDENGHLIRAMYGKIWGDIDIYGSGEISMEYYLNPDYTRNLEFDYLRNLFKAQ